MPTAPRSYATTEIDEALRRAREGEAVEITSQGELVAYLSGLEADPILPGRGRRVLPTPVRLLKAHPTIEEIMAEDRR